MQRITTYLTFDDQAEEAVEFYTSLFPNSRIVSTTRVGEGQPGEKGSLVSAVFELDGQQFMALNGGPSFTFAQGISLFVTCDTQDEVDVLWDRLTSGGGQPGPCGWLTDKFGVSWQIVPRVLTELLNDEDPGKVRNVPYAMRQMSKLDIAALEKAHAA